MTHNFPVLEQSELAGAPVMGLPDACGVSVCRTGGSIPPTGATERYASAPACLIALGLVMLLAALVLP